VGQRDDNSPGLPAATLPPPTAAADARDASAAAASIPAPPPSIPAPAAAPITQSNAAQAASAAYDFDMDVFHPVVARNGMVSSEQELASRIGLQILKSGGNDFHGSLFANYLNDGMVGRSIRGADVPSPVSQTNRRPGRPARSPSR